MTLTKSEIASKIKDIIHALDETPAKHRTFLLVTAIMRLEKLAAQIEEDIHA